MITAAANSVNDIYDVESDRINKPYRPIVSGEVSKNAAIWTSVILYTGGIISGAMVNRAALVIAISAVILTYVYSARLKGVSLWGNLTVALLTSIAFIYGGVAVGRVKESMIPAIFSFFYHFGREVIKDVEDIEGDSKAGLKTFPILYGTEASLKLAGISFGILILLTFLPFLYKMYNIVYLTVVLVGVDLILVYTMFSARRNSGSANLKRLNTLLKVGMLIGLMSIYLGTL